MENISQRNSDSINPWKIYGYYMNWGEYNFHNLVEKNVSAKQVAWRVGGKL